MKEDQDWRRLKIAALLPAITTYQGLESYRADPEKNGQHAVAWNRTPSQTMSKQAWHKWNTMKGVFKGVDLDKPLPTFAIPLIHPHTIQAEAVQCAAARYGAWCSMTQASGDLDTYGFVTQDPNYADSTCKYL